MSKLKTPGLPRRLSRKKFWFEGGTAHHATGEQWSRLDFDNQLATLADFVCALKNDPENKYQHQIYFQDPNQLLVNYVVPLQAGLAVLLEKNINLNSIRIEFAVICMAFQLKMIYHNPLLADQAEKERADMLRRIEYAADRPEAPSSP